MAHTSAEYSAGLFRGQQIRSDQSHKSYRPVTILSLRVINWAGKLLPNGKSSPIHLSVCRMPSILCDYTQHVVTYCTAGTGVNWHSADKHDNTGGLNAFPFHLANVVVHAVNSCLVYR